MSTRAHEVPPSNKEHRLQRHTCSNVLGESNRAKHTHEAFQRHQNASLSSPRTMKGNTKSKTKMKEAIFAGLAYAVASCLMVLCNKAVSGIFSSMWTLVLFQSLFATILHGIGILFGAIKNIELSMTMLRTMGLFFLPLSLSLYSLSFSLKISPLMLKDMQQCHSHSFCSSCPLVSFLCTFNFSSSNKHLDTKTYPNSCTCPMHMHMPQTLLANAEGYWLLYRDNLCLDTLATNSYVHNLHAPD